MSNIEELVKRSSLVFTGKVAARGVSTVLNLPPRDNFVVVRAERGLQVAPALGELNGRKVTLVTADDTLSIGHKAVFFTLYITHGRDISAREVAHLDIEREEEVAAAIARLSDMHLAERLNRAELVVFAEVIRVRPLTEHTPGHRGAQWAMATLQVECALKGSAEVAHVFFPMDQAFPWYDAPSFRVRQRGIFLLHRDDPRIAAWLSQKNLGFVALTALDPADFQGKAKLNQLKQRLATNQGTADARPILRYSPSLL